MRKHHKHSIPLNVTLSPAFLEALAEETIDNAISGFKGEDSRVELKRELPDPSKAARQIAAVCNAVVGQDALWVVGFDEKSRAFHPPANDLAKWWPQVESHFDGTAPTCKDYIVRIKGEPLLLLHFHTSMRPFVVVGADNLTAVPWRSSTTTRNAKRSELLGLLVPTITRPNYEIVSSEITLERSNSRLTVEMEIYIIPTNDRRLAMPLHKCEVRVDSNGRSYSFAPASLSWFEPPGNLLRAPLQLIFERPAFFGFVGVQQFDELKEWPLSGDASLVFTAGFAGSEITIEVVATPPQGDSNPTFQRFSGKHERWFRR